MPAPTIIVGDMNATPTPADRGGQATPHDHAVRDTVEMLGLVDLTANLEGQPSHFPHQTEAAPSRIDVWYGNSTTVILKHIPRQPEPYRTPEWVPEYVPCTSHDRAYHYPNPIQHFARVLGNTDSRAHIQEFQENLTVPLYHSALRSACIPARLQKRRIQPLKEQLPLLTRVCRTSLCHCAGSTAYSRSFHLLPRDTHCPRSHQCFHAYQSPISKSQKCPTNTPLGNPWQWKSKYDPPIPIEGSVEDGGTLIHEYMKVMEKATNNDLGGLSCMVQNAPKTASLRLCEKIVLLGGT